MTREVVLQYRDFLPNEPKEFLLDEGERIVCVESGTRFNPETRVWIEVPLALAKRREEDE